MAENYQFIAKTYFGLEEVVVKELTDLGAKKIQKLNRGVSFEGDMELMYRANMALRSVSKVLLVLDEFTIESPDDLYFKAKKINWDEWFDVSKTFALEHTVYSSLFEHTNFAALRVKDAIADRFRMKDGIRPDVDRNKPDIVVHVFVSNKQCTISLNSSGDPLFKRGYRVSQSMAPIKEDQAAGLIALTQWDKKTPFYDLFCGSGTLLIEAAMMALNRAPNVQRRRFGFHHWKQFTQVEFLKSQKSLKKQELKSCVPIVGIDISSQAVESSNNNIEKAKLEKYIQVFHNDFYDFVPKPTKGIVVSNPPYGERIGENVSQLYSMLGRTLKRKFQGYKVWLISNNQEALEAIDVDVKNRIKQFNGQLECEFVELEVK